MKQCKVYLGCHLLDMLLTSALVDYAFTLLEHALSLAVKLASCGPELAFCLFLRKMTSNSLSRKHCHSPLLTCHSPAEQARLLLPVPSSPVICLSVHPSGVQWATCCREEREVQNLVEEGNPRLYLVFVPCKAEILCRLGAK